MQIFSLSYDEVAARQHKWRRNECLLEIYGSREAGRRQGHKLPFNRIKYELGDRMMTKLGAGYNEKWERNCMLRWPDRKLRPALVREKIVQFGLMI